MANLSFNDCAVLLASINQQATGQAALTPTNTAEFISVAQTTLATGYDKVVNAISQVLSKTIFATRPYSRKLAGLNATAIRYGNHVRKLSMVDSDPEADERHTTDDGKSVDMFKVNKPKVVQTNFYNANVYQRHITLYKDQFDVAFSNPEEFAAFITMIVSNVSDQIEKEHENCARFTLCNLIGGKLAGDANNVVHLVTEYNAATGAELTSATVRRVENFVPFMKWAMARIRTLSEMMTERSYKFHVNLTDKNIPRHTPLDKQKVYLYAPDMHNMETSVLSSVYHDEYLKKVDYETVNYWQAIDEPTSINVNATYMQADGTLTSNAATSANVFGVIFDEEAAGYTTVNEWSSPTPFNAAGGYTNIYHHFTNRYWNDFTENCVVLLMD